MASTIDNRGQKDSAGGFADIASSALEKKKHDLYLKNKTPVKTFDQVKESTPHPTTRLIPSVLPLSAKSAESAKPIQPGWLVAYYDKMGRLRGGTDEWQVGTVAACNHTFVRLAHGEQVPLSRIVGVASTNESGGIRAAWLVQRHGLDGQRENLDENQT